MRRLQNVSGPGLDELKKLCQLARKQSPKKPRYPDRVKELIAEQFAGGMSVSELTKSTGISEGCIRRSLRQQKRPSPKTAAVKIVDVIPAKPEASCGEMVLSLETPNYRVCVFSSGVHQ